MDVLIPPDIPIAEIEWRILDNTAVSTSPLNGVTTTFTRPGTRWGARLSFRNLKDRDRARLLAILAAVRGRSGRVYFTSAADPARSGGYSFPELFTNADFSNGVTGWTAQNCTLSVTDRVMRLTAARSSSAPPGISQNPTVTQYRPLVARGFFGARTRSGLTLGIYANGAGNYAVDRQGLQAVSWVPSTTNAGSTYPIVYDGAGNISITGDWIDTPFVSLAHGAIVDNGPNALLYSDQIDNAAWSKSNVTVTADFFNDPSLAATMERVSETTANSTHQLQQTTTKAAVAQDWCFAGWFRAGTNTDARNRILLRVGDVNGSDYVQGFFDLSTGVADTPTASGGAANPRSFIRALGNGLYYCAIIGTTSTSTAIGGRVYLVQSGTTTSYAGLTTADIGVGRLALAQSSVPVRLTQTTSAATTGVSQTGSGLYLKGLPASTQNIRAAGDMVEIVLPTSSQLVRLTAALDSDAAGLGYLQFENPVRTSPADNAAVIFNQPMMRGILSEGPMWPTRPGLFSDFDLDLIEDIAP